MMKKFCLIVFGLIFLLTSQAIAQNKVVVVPLFGDDCDAIQTVTSNGQVWMDRNLGAVRVAQSVDDYRAYGWLYQWGRLADGHEVRSSDTTATLSSGNDPNVPGHDNFITVNASPYDWRSPQNDGLWHPGTGINNPCPAGFRVPTETEWETERASWSSQNAAGAFASPLKLVVAGWRLSGDGAVFNDNSHGVYWSSTVNGIWVSSLWVYHVAHMHGDTRAIGFSVRCIKD